MIKSPENTVNVAVTKLLFLGPSLQGKTVTRKRLTKMIRNLSSDPSDDKSNTGICEQSTVITCKDIYRGVILAEEEGDDWKVAEDIEKEVEAFINTQSIPKDKFDSSVESPQQYIPNETLKTKESPEQKSLDSSVEEISSSPPPSVHSETETHEKTHVNVSSKLSVEDIQISHEYVSQCLKKAYSLSEIKLHLNNRCMIYLQDTGGQPELMDCLPALTIGPALYLLFCKLNTNLDDHYTIGYRGTDGKTSSLLSHFTIKETLLSALVSISSMLYSSSDDCAEIKQQFENRQQCVYIIGTHRDKVKDDSSIDAFEKNLKEAIDSTFFYKKGLIKEWYQDDFPANSTLRDSSMRLVYPLDNQNGGSDEIQCLRRALSQKINQYAKKIPSQWLILGIVLRGKRGKREVMVNLETCVKIGRRLNMNKSQTEAALHFLHYNLGICMHFSNVKELKDVVITDTQSIYQSLTKIIEAAFKPGIVHEAAASELKNTGQFTLEPFSHKVKTPLPLEVLVIVLEHLNIIAPIPSANKEETTFFMPCILPNASDTEITRYEEENKIPHEVSPLYIRYDCGFVPMGVFSATVAKLIQQSSKIVSLRI